MLDFNRIQQQKIIVVGDIMLDAYLFGSVDRISPEAPVPVVNHKHEEYRLGGAANVALNIAAMGATPIVIGVTGNDADAVKMNMVFEKRSIATDFLVKEADRPTTVKTRIIGNSHQLLRVDKESTHTITNETKKKVLENVLKALPQAQALILEDYDKGLLDEELIASIVDACNKAKVPVAVDPKKRNFLSYKNVTLFKPNLKEIKEGLKLHSLDSMREIEEAAQQLLQQLNLKYIMVTLSERGVLICDTQHTLHFPAHVRKIADVSGAGDTVISIAALCLAQQLPAREIAILSNLAGGLVCEEVGVVPINKEQFQEEALRIARA